MVNGVIYKNFPNLLTTPSEFQQTIIVKYNPNKPSEYVMNANWNILILARICILIVSLIIYVFKIKNY